MKGESINKKSEKLTNRVYSDKSQDVLLKEANYTRKVLMKKVEEILENINKSADAGEIPKITIRNQRLWSNCIYNLDRYHLLFITYLKSVHLIIQISLL